MNLKEYRKSLGLSQEQAGAKIGISKQRWGQIEKSWPNLAVDTLLSIVQEFGTEIALNKNGARFLTDAERERTATQQDLSENINLHIFEEE